MVVIAGFEPTFPCGVFLRRNDPSALLCQLSYTSIYRVAPIILIAILHQKGYVSQMIDAATHTACTIYEQRYLKHQTDYQFA